MTNSFENNEKFNKIEVNQIAECCLRLSRFPSVYLFLRFIYLVNK
jgi:hypothetical protein